ncbi:hypothetical protein EV363DRAFT_1393914 [Boletus edulis]|nr:hypothetical protein EV363DRAFT_1393914 [Boletus edulis]
MPTSELSDALNPYYAQSRPRPAHASGQQRQPPVPQLAAPQHPHRSELELAISVPPRPPDTPPTPLPARSTNPHGGGIHAVQELLRFLASTREAQEIEHKRRVAWEQEQEAKYKFRQAEMERRMLEMQQEIAALKARVAFSSPASSLSVGTSVHVSSDSVVSQPSQLEYSSLIPPPQQPTPSTSPSLSHPSTPMAFSSSATGQPVAGPSTGPAHDLAEASLLPAARFVHVNPPSALRNVNGAGPDSEEEPNVDGDSPPSQYRVRRKNHHDTRCLTIQHAMRNHILRVMMLETDRDLPDSHAEGTPLGPNEPVRFVWEKTPKQSVHNGRMKEQVLKDLKANRKLYRHVSDKDFGKKTLDSVFDQAFVTLRQKFKAQRDDSAARVHKQREDLKAQRARRLSRRKVVYFRQGEHIVFTLTDFSFKKLGNRSDARNKMGVFEHVTLDGALQIECMSSEESEVEEDAATGTRTTIFRIRGFPWRSLRLQRFFDVLDEEDKVENAQRPRRGVGRRERFSGPAKEGVMVPPRGVASWMISKGWLRVMAASHGEVVGMLQEIIVDPVGFDWTQFEVLGEESE